MWLIRSETESGTGTELARVFRSFDEDGNGSLDKEELRNGLASLNANVSAEQLADFFAILDTDGDGEISYLEFARWFGTWTKDADGDYVAPYVADYAVVRPCLSLTLRCLFTAIP